MLIQSIQHHIHFLMTFILNIWDKQMCGALIGNIRNAHIFVFWIKTTEKLNR